MSQKTGQGRGEKGRKGLELRVENAKNWNG